MTQYQIQAQVTYGAGMASDTGQELNDGISHTRSVPTFIIDSAIQGSPSAFDAAKVAFDVIGVATLGYGTKVTMTVQNLVTKSIYSFEYAGDARIRGGRGADYPL